MSELDRIYFGGIDEKTLKSHYRQPHKRSTSHTQQLIESLHKRYFPSPFPADTEALMRIYNNLVDCPKHATTEADVADLRLFLQAQVNEQGMPLLRAARLNWLLANTYFDDIGALRTARKRVQLQEYQKHAIQHYQQAITLIETHNQEAAESSVSEFVLYKVHQNILACYLNAIEPEHRESDEQVLNYLTHSDFLSQSKKVLVQEPYLWVVARNGLRFGSLLKSATLCEQFFRLLVAASPYFLDLDYAPQGYPAICNSKEFNWACQHVLSAGFIDTLRG